MAFKWTGVDANGTTHITVAYETHEYAADANDPNPNDIIPPFSNPIPDDFKPVVEQALHAWESVANIKFDFVPDTSPDLSASSPDIRLGLSAFHAFPPTANNMGWTFMRGDNATQQFVPGGHVAIEDPAETPVFVLEDGDFHYGAGHSSTVLQNLMHEIGHALGLNHPDLDPRYPKVDGMLDTHSIMYVPLGAQNMSLDGNDIAVIRSMYGAPVLTNLQRAPITPPGSIINQIGDLTPLDILGFSP